MLERIKLWLSGNQNYIIGRVLYNQYGNDNALKQILNAGQSAQNATLLREALTALLPAPAPAEESREQMPETNDATLNSIREEWLPKYRRMNYMIATLDSFGESNTPDAITAREAAALEILKLEKFCMECWAKRDYYNANGKLPVAKETPVILPDNPDEAKRLLSNIQRNIRRNKALAIQHPDEPQYNSLAKHYTNILKQLQAQSNENKL